MLDLLLFRLLARGDHDDERVPALLEELAKESLRDRAPFFGLLVEIAADERAPRPLRLRALDALGGATGLVTIETAAACLHDQALAARAARILAFVARSEPARWAHVAFHPSPWVRADGLALSSKNEATRDWDLCLVGDPMLRDAVLADAEAGALSPPGGLAVLIDMVRAGALPAPVAWKIVQSHPALLGQARAALRRREHALVTQFLEGSVSDDPNFALLERTEDEIDVLLSIVPDEGGELVDKAIQSAAVVGLELAAAAWIDLHRRGPTPSRLAIIARFYPASLLSKGLSHADVRTASRTYLRASTRAPDWVAEKLLANRAIRPDGGADLACAAAFVRLFEKAPFARLLATIEVALLRMALIEEPIDDVVTLLSLHDEDDIGRRAVLHLVPLSAEGRTRATILAALAVSGPSSLFGFVAGEPELPIALRDPGFARLSGDRAEGMAKALVIKLGADVFRLLLELGTANLGCSFARAVVLEASLGLTTAAFVAPLAGLEPSALAAILSTLEPGALLLGKELALAEALRDHPHDAVAAWARARVPDAAPRDAPKARQRQGIAYRAAPPSPSAEACVALLGSMDPVEATDRAFIACFDDSPAFVAELDRAMVAAYGPTAESISALGHAWLWRWDAHALAHLDRGLEDHTTLAALIRARLALRSPALARASLAAIASVLGVLSMRDRRRYLDLVDDEALHALVIGLSGPAVLSAATALRMAARSQMHHLGEISRAVRLLLPDLDDETRAVLAPLVDAEGLLPRRITRLEPKLDQDLLVRIRATTDTTLLARWTSDERVSVVHEATLRLVELGEEALAVLLGRITAAPSADRVRPIIESIPLWPEGGAKSGALAVPADEDKPLDVRFRVALVGIECGTAGAVDLAAALLGVEHGESFFEPRDWETLLRAAGEAELALTLAASAQPHAYIRAVEHLLAATPSADRFDALRAFLDRGTRRMGSLRRRVAMHLHQHGDDHGFALVLGQCFEESTGRGHLFDRAPASLVRVAAMTFLAAGVALAKEPALVHHLSSIPAHVAEEALEAVMTHGVTDKARMAAARMLSTRAARERKLLRIAEVFVWGARIAQRALGKPMRIRMTGTQKLGFTRTRENAIFVTPLPILRGDPHGQEVVAALILHELGHHLYHAGPAAEKVWKRAEQAGLHGVFNLVADEHLERNLRAIDARWGDLLKRLAAYAFQHTDRTVAVTALISHLGARAFEVLSNTRLEPARDDKSVKVDSGSLLFTMERAGLSFARFARALRMGLGNRHADPKVERALALFAQKFRQSSMEDLWKITLELKEIFGFETRLCDSIGPHEELEEGGVEGLVWNDGITQEEIDRLIERVVTGEGGTRPTSGAPSGRLYLNVDPETKFDLIKEVRPVPYDPVAYAPYRRKVNRPAAMLRQFLEELGLSFVERRMLVSGRRVDQRRLLPLALQGDPRAMRTREVKPYRDLYLGLVVDCSGSMATRENIERAKLFGALITEAARPLSQVDVRVFGFTDRVIFDCGPKDRCAVHALTASGGNNDAAALYHVAACAKGSRRKAKVLVMISDGLPTECSVAALKHLVTHLTRREGMIVAQVAVQPISERCFPHYVVLTDASIEATVRKFGGIIAGLVQKALTQ